MMEFVLPILSALGDSKWHFKEEIYPMVRLSIVGKFQYRSLRSFKNIDDAFKTFLEYNLIRRGKSQNIQIKNQILKVAGYDCYQITEKGLQALDHYRNMSGAKDPSKGDLFGSDENAQRALANKFKNKGER